MQTTTNAEHTHSRALHTYLFALEVFDPLEVFDRGVLRRYRAPRVLTA